MEIQVGDILAQSKLEALLKDYFSNNKKMTITVPLIDFHCADDYIEIFPIEF